MIAVCKEIWEGGSIKPIRIIIVTMSTFAAAGLTADFFNGILIFSLGLCYDYYDWWKKGRKLSRIFGYIAFAFSFFLVMFSLLGVMGYINLDPETGLISSNTLLLPELKFNLKEDMSFLWAFPFFAGIEVFLGRSDFVDKKR